MFLSISQLSPYILCANESYAAVNKIYTLSFLQSLHKSVLALNIDLFQPKLHLFFLAFTYIVNLGSAESTTGKHIPLDLETVTID